jgi:hypothetical protein
MFALLYVAALLPSPDCVHHSHSPLFLVDAIYIHILFIHHLHDSSYVYYVYWYQLAIQESVQREVIQTMEYLSGAILQQ